MRAEFPRGRVHTVDKFGPITIGTASVILPIIFVDTAFRFIMSFWLRSSHCFLAVHYEREVPMIE